MNRAGEAPGGGRQGRAFMVGVRMLSVLALAVALSITPAASQAESGGVTDQLTPAAAAEKAAAEKVAAEKAAAKKAAAEKAAAEKAAAEKAAAEKERSFSGEFATPVLAGGAVNELEIPVPPLKLRQIPEMVTIEWDDADYTTDKRICPREMDSPKPSEKISVRSRRIVKDDEGHIFLRVQIPPPRCWWPLTQHAKITIKGNVVGDNDVQTFFDETVPISVFWIPLLVTLLVLAFIYPGCAMVAWYLAKRDYEKDCQDAKKKGQPQPDEPRFLATLDPVQITATPHGRGSLGKLQIFVFSLLVFGLLFYYQLRYGILAGISQDVMLLMGISAVGAVGAKITYRKKRRLSLENWTWMERKRWLYTGRDVQARAKWRELVLDSDTKEFDPYSFQMAVFSLVVAVALVRTGLSGLGAFEIPAELLQLLGLSQVVFIGGKAVETTSYEELEKQLKDVREQEAKAQVLKDDPDPAKKAEAETALKAFRASAARAADIFWATYSEQLPERPPALDKVAEMQPGEGDSSSTK